MSDTKRPQQCDGSGRYDIDDVCCPHCHCKAPSIFELLDTDLEIVTYSGDAGPSPIGCKGCGNTYYVKEHVVRTYSHVNKGGLPI